MAAMEEGEAVEFSPENGIFEQCTLASHPSESLLLLRRKADPAAQPFEASLSAVRPTPPPTPADFFSRLVVGTIVEAATPEGWARGRWLEPVPGSAAPLSVKLEADGMVTSVTEADVRPARDWVDGQWNLLVQPEPAPPPEQQAPAANVKMSDAPADSELPAPEPAAEMEQQPASSVTSSNADTSTNAESSTDMQQQQSATSAQSNAEAPGSSPSAFSPDAMASNGLDVSTGESDSTEAKQQLDPELNAEVSKDLPVKLPMPTVDEARQMYPAGMSAEVTSFEEGLRGSWYPVQIVEPANDAGNVRVRYKVSGTNGSEEEMVASNRLRPLPPEIPTAHIKPLIVVGDKLELFYRQGWWDVVVLELRKTSFVVVAPEYENKHTAFAKNLRPRWSFDLNSLKSDPASKGWSLQVGSRCFTLAEWDAKLATEEGLSANEAAMVEGERESMQPLSAEAMSMAAESMAREAQAEADEEAALDSEALDMRVQHFRWGMAVEVRLLEEEYSGAWRPAEVLKALPNSHELIVSLLDEEGDTCGTRQTVRVARCRPAPPRLEDEALAAWVDSLSPGGALEFWYDNAWWKVELESRYSNSVMVKSSAYKSRHRAPLTHIRPRFIWRSPTRGWAYAQGGAQMELPMTDVIMAHQRPLPSQPQRGGEKRAAAANARVRSKASGGRGGGRGRGGRGSKGRVVSNVSQPAMPCPVAVGEILEVEVAEEDSSEEVSWKPSEVREALTSGRFIACVNGDEDFLEEYGPEDEGREWRRLADQKAGKVAYAAAYKIAQQKAEAARAAELAEAEEAARQQVEKEALAASQATIATPSGAERSREAPSDESDAPQPKKRKVTSSGAAPRPPPGVVVQHKFGFGMAVEVAGDDEGFEHSWYSAEVLKVAAKLLVRYDSLFEEDSRRPLTESIEPARLRPVPPKPHSNWLNGAKPGFAMELKHDDGWWEVELVGVADGGDDVASASGLTVKGVDGLWDGAEIVVDPELLRPGWLWNNKTQSWSTRSVESSSKSKPRSGSRGRGRGGK